MGRTVLVTGATGGIGYFAAEELARRGHRVLLGARDPAKAATATASIRHQVPGADVGFVHLDLADLASVAAAADQVSGGEPLASLVANAAVVSYGLRSAEPRRTVDGHELHFGTAHLGHFALVGRLLPSLQAWGTRVVHVGSLGHRVPTGRDPWARAEHPRPEPSLQSYARSKLAVTVFGLHLAALLESHGSPATSVLAHPGTAVDVRTPPRDGIPASQPMRTDRVSRTLTRAMHGKDAGALVLVHAATARDVRSGECWGPDGRGQLRGMPTRVAVPIAWRERRAGDLLQLSERLTGVRIELSPRPPHERPHGL
jgi:NAD(P)-dependent dehydrogenase (short-subunit alcohol dehydrogenase family)